MMFLQRFVLFCKVRAYQAWIRVGVNAKLPKVKFDSFREAQINSLKIERREQLEAPEIMKFTGKKGEKHRSIKSYEERLGDASRDTRVKTLIDFDWYNSNSIKSLAVKKT